MWIMRGMLREYLKGCVGEVVSRVVDQEICCEVNQLGDVDYEGNVEILIGLVDDLLRNLLRSVDECPAYIRDMYNLLYCKIEARYPDSADVVLTSIFMLRFINSGIILPSVYGICQETPSPQSRRTLVLISKILQALSNNYPFTEKQKELMPFNAFLAQKKEAFEAFVQELHTPGGKETNYTPNDNIQEDIRLILKKLGKKETDVKRILSEL
eukprot:TRINITY_DN4378_c0_g1_i2.p1 TRINITY_DN4378_c0_g1~~TRINITY_DN4378_c0_g1_i2.p1  ORF type:complete len:212 (+),score=43.14 TRINITY_DN4378_c0_g1_i2:21-656(+)